MTNKLTSLTGFGEGDPKDENYAVRRSVAKHEFKKMTDNLPGYLKRRGSYRLHLKNHLLKENDPTKWEKYSGAKSKALSKKVGSADRINAERKRQGYKPMDAKSKRIHEGMDKYLP